MAPLPQTTPLFPTGADDELEVNSQPSFPEEKSNPYRPPNVLVNFSSGSPTVSVPQEPPNPNDDFRHWGIPYKGLPSRIEDVLERDNLEAFWVAGDGNCLYRATAYGPRWRKFDLGRAATAAYLEALQMGPYNSLSGMVDDAQIKKIATGERYCAVSNSRQILR